MSLDAVRRSRSPCATSGFMWYAVGRHRQGADADAGRLVNRIADGRSQTDDGSFTGARRWQILAVEQDCFNHRHVAETGQAILADARIQNAAVFEFDGFERGAPPMP